MKAIKLVTKIIAVVFMFVFIQACNYSGTKKTIANNNDVIIVNNAICVLHPTEGNTVNGIVTFTKTNSGIHVVADIEGLTPGKHGFHIHEFGDCSKSDGTTAGGHLNPENMEHGSQTDSVRHVGDLGNIVANAEGQAHLDQTDTMISMSGEHSIIGRGIVVHMGEDDLKTQPTGAAGARVACGVIGIAK